VRYAHRVPVLEPFMVALVGAAARYLSTVRKDSVGRPGRITRLIARGRFMPEGEAPLAKLLGYQRCMRDMLANHWNESRVAMWLGRYVPVEDNGPAMV
jgi:hypothetical protein